MEAIVLAMKNSLGVIVGDQDFKPEVLTAAFIQNRKHSIFPPAVGHALLNHGPV